MCHSVSPGHGTLVHTSSATLIIIPFVSHPSTHALQLSRKPTDSDCLKFWAVIVNSKYNDTGFNVKPETAQTLKSEQSK